MNSIDLIFDDDEFVEEDLASARRITRASSNPLELSHPWHISFDMIAQEKEEAKLAFYEKTGFPGVVVFVDGMRIRIITLGKEIQHIYYNRKSYHRINAMLVCDRKMRIRFVDARHSGSCHDSFIWTNCHLKGFLEERLAEGEMNSWVLGDSGYLLQPFLITPFQTITEGSIEAAFNRVHSNTRNVVEKSIGVLKNRFRCILGARELHYKTEKATQIINACCSLHNICIHFNVDNNADYIEEDPDTTEEQRISNNNENANKNATSTQNNIMHSIVYE